MPLAELIITANMLETDATITGHFSHDAYVAARSFQGVEAPFSRLVAAGPRPFTSAQMQNT